MLTKPTRKQIIGARAEDLALQYLEQQGLRLLARNYRITAGEIDLILQVAHTLVFVEVRARKIGIIAAQGDFGGALASVTISKQARLVRAAQHYLQTHFAREPACRFDVVTVGVRGETLEIDEWIQDAFGV